MMKEDLLSLSFFLENSENRRHRRERLTFTGSWQNRAYDSSEILTSCEQSSWLKASFPSHCLLAPQSRSPGHATFETII